MLHLTADSFESRIYDAALPVIVMFYADWCSKCAMMKPVAESLEKKHNGKIIFYKVNIDESVSLAKQYQIEIVPTFVFFKDGQIEAAFGGIIDETVFEQRTKKIFHIFK